MYEYAQDICANISKWHLHQRYVLRCMLVGSFVIIQHHTVSLHKLLKFTKSYNIIGAQSYIQPKDY